MIEITQVLRDEGFEVTCPQPARDGTPFFVHEGSIYTLYTWLNGRRLLRRVFSADEAEFLGEQLGRIHQTLNAISQRYPLRVQRYPKISDVVARVEKLLSLIRSRQSLTESDKRALSSLDYKRRILGSNSNANIVASMYEAPQLVHGDFRSGNMLFTSHESRRLGLFDLESFQYAPRIWDIAKASLFTFSGDVERIVCFLAGYHRVNPLRADELTAFFPLAMHYMLCSTWTEEEHLLHGNTLATIGNTTALHQQLFAQSEKFKQRMIARSLL